MDTAIFYHPEAYTISGPKLMGRNAAGESFLRGFLAHSSNSKFWIQVVNPDHVPSFAEAVRKAGRQEPVQAVDKAHLGALSQAGLIHHPEPSIGDHAWNRAAFGHAGWSLCGITHTTSSATAMDAITSLLTAPVQSWDALICTSRAVKDNVTRLLQAQVDYLKARLGISRVTLPMLPVIPLGIHTADFVFTAQARAAARRALKIDKDMLVVLFMGRLSFHAKAHPLAMYQALERAAKSSGKSVVLIECGWHANDYIAGAFAAAAQTACPSVRTITLDGREAEARQTAWAAADIFCSLSDNIQETFGITPIEAMAAGLPVVVSDWDGYKDTVRDGVDGFRIPTLMPQPGMGADLAKNHALGVDTYDRYCGYACMLTAIDIGAAAEAFTRLFTSPELRAKLGAAGRERARGDYDWATIIRQYEALWQEQTAHREKDGGSLPALAHPWPARLEPFHAFASYPTQTLTVETRLDLVDGNFAAAEARLRDYRTLAMVQFTDGLMPENIELMAVLAGLADGAQSAGALLQGQPAERRRDLFRCLGYLAKLGIIRTVQ